MAVTNHMLNKVGFSPREAALLQELYNDATEPTLKQLVTAGFTARQATVLLSGTPSPDAGVTPAVKPSLKDLMVRGHFTRHQAKLIRDI